MKNTFKHFLNNDFVAIKNIITKKRLFMDILCWSHNTIKEIYNTICLVVFNCTLQIGPVSVAYVFFNMEQNDKTLDFISKAKKIHGNKYDYSLVNYIRAIDKVCIICPKHGEFWQTPHNHISSKSGCPKCCKNHNRYTTKDFIEKANSIHNNKYDYSLVVYESGTKHVNIICPIHGVFKQAPGKHLNGQGCPICGKKKTWDKAKKTTKQFITEAQKIHGDKYDYSLTDYINSNKKVKIICKKHGIFEQTPHHHLNFHGCPHCSNSTLENELALFLAENNISFIQQYRNKWLGRQSLDFYLPDYNVGIECQGEQHFKKVYYRSKSWNEDKAQKNFINIVKRDIDKKNIAATSIKEQG